ncbi:hypothetical protein LX64_03555 [Chitinophaga skermanii]|uniref:Predicted 3'-5' exonuclease PolB-like domain-containing protein n=1 Tax=Chitinophaga skermanii TaxID=331697 RepID=A0A327QEV6_9BACT|nr:ribonuclease H-like domain-containing protein [Chitinophaga skermanii]RAJ02535.1 hypothetical protein LX64_03555 [Chitinophaga skermanii]
MLNNVALDQLLLLDIETTPLVPSFSELPGEMQDLWLEKFTKTAPESGEPQPGYFEKAGIYAEFGKIVCISVGFFYVENGKYNFRIKSFFNDDEQIVLTEFLELVQKFHLKYPRFQFAGHNIKDFDIPYICRRAIIKGLILPPALQIHGLKPWEMPMLDTMQIWRFGDFKNYTSLKLLAAVLGIPSPKDDIDGSMVASVYWEKHDLKRISEYCQKDVLTVAQLLLRFKHMPLLNDNEVTIIGN